MEEGSFIIFQHGNEEKAGIVQSIDGSFLVVTYADGMHEDYKRIHIGQVISVEISSFSKPKPTSRIEVNPAFSFPSRSYINPEVIDVEFYVH